MNNVKKIYTHEDNVKYISFGIRDISKEMAILNQTLQAILDNISAKQFKDDEVPF